MANNNHFSEDPLWEAHRPYVEALARMTGSHMFVVVRDEGYPFFSPRIEMLGYDVPEARIVPDDSFLKERIHPDDRRVFDDFLDKLFDYLTTIPEERRSEYKYIFEFRLMGRGDKYIRVICQLQILGFNHRGNPVELGTLDISPDQTPDMGLRFTLLNFKTGEIVPFDIHMEACTNLTRREKEVLKLIDSGMYSREISERLSISIHTVNRHRQNILEKMDAANTRKAVNYARRLGLLSSVPSNS